VRPLDDRKVQSQTSRIHLFVLAFCVTGCMAVALYPRRVSPTHSVEVVTELVHDTIARLLTGGAAGGKRP